MVEKQLGREKGEGDGRKRLLEGGKEAEEAVEGRRSEEKGERRCSGRIRSEERRAEVQVGG